MTREEIHRTLQLFIASSEHRHRNREYALGYLTSVLARALSELSEDRQGIYLDQLLDASQRLIRELRDPAEHRRAG
jgi:hypothetical protein